MGKRTKRATSRKAKAPRKVAKKARAPKKKAAKGQLNTREKRQKTTAKSRRSAVKPGAKKAASRRRRTPTQQRALQPEMMIVETAQSETTIVDVIEEPVSGVFVVTEFVETNAEPEPTESSNTLDIDQTVGPESEGQKQ